LDCKRAAKRAYGVAHRTEVNQRAADYRARVGNEILRERKNRSMERNPELYRQTTATWKRTHKESVNRSTQKRRAAIAQAGASITAAEWTELKTRYDSRCLMCHRQEPEILLTPDHVVSVSNGGTNALTNIQPLCESCNSKKHRLSFDLRLYNS